MTTVTRTLTILRSGTAHRALRQWAVSKMHATLAALARSMLSVPAVQREVAAAFSGATPMCRVLESAIDGHDFEVDDVRGLERFVEEAIEEALNNSDADKKVHADDVEDLEDFVVKAVEEVLQNSDSVGEAAAEFIVNKLSR